MPPKRTRAQGTGETSHTQSLSLGSKNPSLTAEQIAQLIATTVEQILADRPESHPPLLLLLEAAASPVDFRRFRPLFWTIEAFTRVFGISSRVIVLSSRLRGRAVIPHSHLPAGIVATMRRVVNYHSSWARQQQVELFEASGNLGSTAGRGFNPAGGAPGGELDICCIYVCFVVVCFELMPPRRRGRSRGLFQESGGQNEDQYSAPSHTRESSGEEEAVAPPAPVERMDVVIARFQRMSPPIFNGDESSEDADSWLHNVILLFDRAQYDNDLRLRLVTLLFRKAAERWWRGASRTLEETGVELSWDVFCETFKLIATTVEQILADRPESHPPLGQQSRGDQETARGNCTPEGRKEHGPNSAASSEGTLLSRGTCAELPQDFKFPNVGEYDEMGDLEEHFSRFETPLSSISMQTASSAEFP
ncbi:hypothetical protein F511_37583 [Dorcoceras hygrometricum]|uniref:Uncharacterized protein n=1 Tax=Dorcoceras hygrometricum TaxID=472368 RepID=A0A2Z7BIR1_9LAMI|nr:hypothetical protein F511_37583 [Dorcoceras hygrometricum]